MTLQERFLRHLCQTSPEPLGLEIARAQGPFLYTRDGRRYLDLIAGIGVANVGHGRPEILAAIQEQAQRYLHAMVYGEFILEPQVRYAAKLAEMLPGEIDNVFFANSGAEAVEGALKLARKSTGRRKVFSFEGCYHGDTFGAMSCQSEPVYRAPFEPCVPEIYALAWDDAGALQQIDEQTAGVIIEPVQAEGGVRVPESSFMHALQRRCREAGALLIFDEVMTGFGRTGKMFAAEHWQLAPDVMVLAKALGGGLPLGAFAARREVMQTLSHNPPLAHVTTFGGHPLSCAAGLAALDILISEKLPVAAERIGHRLYNGLLELQGKYGAIRDVRGKGCLIGIEFERAEWVPGIVRRCRDHGVIIGWTLYHSNILRMAPPLILKEEEITLALGVFENALQAELA